MKLNHFGEYEGQKIGFKGRLEPISAEALGVKLEAKIGSPVKVIGSGEVQTLGVGFRWSGGYPKTGIGG